MLFKQKQKLKEKKKKTHQEPQDLQEHVQRIQIEKEVVSNF